MSSKKHVRKLIWCAILLAVTAVMLFCSNDPGQAVDGVTWILMIGLILIALFTDNNEFLSINISVPVGIVFFVLFALVPLPALLFPKSIWGLVGTLIMTVVSVVFCAWFAKKTKRHG